MLGLGELRRALVAAAVIVIVCAGPATAGPADLDTGFGDGGLVIAPGADRLDPEEAPMLRPGGRIRVAGVLRNSSDRVFLAAFGSDGKAETSFGELGELHTNVRTGVLRRAGTAQLDDGRMVVAGGSTNNGGFDVQRFLENGQVDTSFGGGNGKISGSISASYLEIVAAEVQRDGRTLLSAYTNHGGGNHRSFVILRLTDTGLDPTWGSGGVARVTFGKRNATAWDLAPLSNGKVIAVGSVGDGSATNTAAIRLNPNGTLDTSYGSSGRVEHDASGNGSADHAVAAVTDATGAVTLAGPARNGAGMLGRLTSTGAWDAGFGTQGLRVGGLTPTGTSFDPVDLATDAAGRVVVAARATTGTGTVATTRWAALRIRTAGADPVDAAFGAQAVQLSPCANQGGHGPTGVAISDTQRILLLGACGAEGRVAAIRLFGREALKGGALDVSPTAQAAGHERIPFKAVEPAAVIKAVADLQEAELHETDLRANPVRPNPVRPNPVRPNPVRPNTLLRALPVRPNPVRPNPVRPNGFADLILLSDIPLTGGRTWSELLGIEGPLQAYTLADAFRINPEATGNLTLADFDPRATFMRNLTLASIVLGSRPLSALPEPAGGWCDFLAGMPFDCDNGVDVSSTSLFELEASGDDLTAYLSQPMKIAAPSVLGTGADAAPLALIPLIDIELSQTPFGEVPAAAVADLLGCDPECEGTLAERQYADGDDFSTATLGDLVARVPLPGVPQVTLGEVLLGLVAASEIPYERASRKDLLAAAAFRDDDLQAYTSTFELDCAQAAGLEARPALPDDARAVPGGATVSIDGGEPKPVPDGDPRLDLSGICAGAPVGHVAAVTLRMLVEPGSTLGLREAAVTIGNALGEVSGSDDIRVDDSRDPGDAFDQTRELTTDALRSSHIADGTDVDSWSVVPDQRGSITVAITNLPADFDLAVYGPDIGLDSSPVRPNPVRPNPVRPNPVRPNELVFDPVADTSREFTDGQNLPPDTVQDIPVRPNPVRPNTLIALSAHRGRDAESVTFTVGPNEVGREFLVQVTGYNGAHAAEPYTARRYDRPEPPAPPCLQRSPLTAGGPGEFPANVPADTQTLYIVNLQRLAARDGQAAANGVRDRLARLAAETKGVVIPVESDPQGRTAPAYNAWDANQCDVDAANAVAVAINAVVDDVRAMGDGLEDLRHMVLVGSDDIVPQIRVPDLTVLANERDYADEAVVRDKENAVSASKRQGFILTDDGFFDFDPHPRLSVPDVAGGRLIGSSAQIAAQADAWLNGDRHVPLSDLSVAGYDFLSDGSQATFDALKGVFGSARARIDDTWDDAYMLGEMNRSGAGFTALNAHFSHTLALPSAAFSGQGSGRLIDFTQAEPEAGQMAFTVGCHSGLSFEVPLAGLTADEQAAAAGWAGRYGASRALYIGNTGYGYGDTEAIAMSEKLMADAALFWATREVTAAQALMFAKQANANLLTDDYWTKSSMEATFYGLPFYRIGQNGGQGGPALPPVIEPPAEIALASASIPPVRPAFAEQVTDRGRFWEADGEEPVVVQHRPIQPRTTLDVTRDDGLIAHGFLPDGFETSEIDGVDPVIARPTIDLGEHEPEPEGDSPLFPARKFAVESVQTPDGRMDRLNLVVGEFRGDRQRLFTKVTGRVFASDSADFTPAEIQQVDGIVQGDSFAVAVQTDSSDLAGGNMLYRTDGGTAWHRSPLAPTGGRRLGTGGRLPNGTKIVEAKIYVLDTSGNVSTSEDKIRGFEFAPLPDPGEAGPIIRFEPDRLYHDDSPLIYVEPGTEHQGASFEYSIDGGPYKVYSGPFRVPEPDEGEHFILVRGSDGSAALARLAVDTNGPTAVVTQSPGPNEHGWNDGDVVVSFDCADAVSGVASCPEPITVTGEGRNLSVTATATDRAGNSSTLRYDGINIDRTKPSVAGSRDRGPNADGWYKAAVTVSWACEDALSGIGFCSGPALLDQEGAKQQATGRAIDRAGNEGRATVGPVNIDLTAPTVSIKPPQLNVLVDEYLTGHVADKLSGVYLLSGDECSSDARPTCVTYENQVTGQKKHVRIEVVGCDHPHEDPQELCWRVPSPGPGSWKAHATAFDLAGNEQRSEGVVFSVR